MHLARILKDCVLSYLRGELEFEFDEVVFWAQLSQLVCAWCVCMRPVLGLTYRQAVKAARRASASRNQRSSGIRAFMAAQRKAAAEEQAAVTAARAAPAVEGHAVVSTGAFPYNP